MTQNADERALEAFAKLDTVRLACGLWAIVRDAEFLAEDPPEEEDYDGDTEAAYNQGENVAMWKARRDALTILAEAGDADASEQLKADTEAEDARYVDPDDEGGA